MVNNSSNANKFERQHNNCHDHGKVCKCFKNQTLKKKVIKSVKKNEKGLKNVPTNAQIDKMIKNVF